MRTLLIALIALLTLALCVVAVGGAYFFLTISQTTAVTVPPSPQIQIVEQVTDAPSSAPPTRARPTDAPATTTAPLPPTLAAPTLAAPTPSLSGNDSTLDMLLNNDVPVNDRVRLAQAFKGIIPNLATPAAPRQYKVGDKETFWVSRDPNHSENEQTTATLRYINNVAYMWVEDGEKADDAALKKSADFFAANIYPTHHKYLGSEAIPGVDNDPHLNILNARIGGGIAGYYGQSDSLPKEIHSHSNQREMFYMSLVSTKPGTQYYNSVLAHEFAHMIHRYANERGESSWITEGFGDLGMELNGFSAGHQESFTQNPDIQINAWEVEPPGASIPHYGAAYLFLSYQLNRFGIDYIRSVFSSNTTGIPSIQQALDKFQPGMTFDDVFADWVAANFMQDAAQDTRYNYSTERLDIRPTVGYSAFPARGSDTIHQYGADYIQLLPDGKDISFSFDGSDTVRVIPTDAHSGNSFWWSGRTDLSDATLTREMDLSSAKNATLKFWTWYDIEDDFDFAYVAVSTDGGKTWKPLQGDTTTDRDLNATNYGNGLTCKSGAGCGDWQAEPQWIQEEMDLTPYAGQKILLRFEQITDEVYTGSGLAVDDIEIPEIGFKDDAEQNDAAWTAAGFARIDNVLPQRFIVQAIEFGRTPRVVPLQLDAQNRGTYRTQGFGKNISRVVIVVSGSTPVTWQLADYEYQIQ
ncbi:MAG: immune inhibitor A [Chloroflexi bacterium]|nr:immune inhibitor A [Chloroflexota bacterium]